MNINLKDVSRHKVFFDEHPNLFYEAAITCEDEHELDIFVEEHMGIEAAKQPTCAKPAPPSAPSQYFPAPTDELKALVAEDQRSGNERRVYESGAVRSTDKDNVAYHLLSPFAIRLLAMVCREGELKYAAFNCEKGFPADECLNHALDHIMAFLAGNRHEPHLPHAMWNLMTAMHSIQHFPELNLQKFRDLLGFAPTRGEYKDPIVGYNQMQEMLQAVENARKAKAASDNPQIKS